MYDRLSLSSGDHPPPVVEQPTSSKPPHHVQSLPTEGKKQEEASKTLETKWESSTETGVCVCVDVCVVSGNFPQAMYIYLLHPLLCPEQATMGTCRSSTKIWEWTIAWRSYLNGSTIPVCSV